MLQGSGAMPTLVVEEGLIPFASGETPPLSFGFMAHRNPAQGCHAGIYESAKDSAFPQNPYLPSPVVP